MEHLPPDVNKNPSAALLARRSVLVGGLLATPVVLTLKADPVWGQAEAQGSSLGSANMSNRP
jgi:hypothetical protein